MIELTLGLGIFLCCISLFSWVFLYIAVLVTLQHYNPAHPAVRYNLHIKYSVAVYVVSAIQGLLSSGVGITIIGSCYSDVIHATHPLAHWYAWVAMAYFIYDLWAMYKADRTKSSSSPQSNLLVHLLSFARRSPVMVSHHIVLTLVLLPVLIYRRGVGDFFVGCFYCLEFSALFTNFRSIISKLGYKNTRLYKVNGVVMVFTFALCRVAMFPFMYWCYGVQYQYKEDLELHELDADAAHELVRSRRSGLLMDMTVPIYKAVLSVPLHCTVGCSVVLLPQLYWLAIMVRTAAKMITERENKRQLVMERKDI